jgi:hypothetical protein
MKMSFKLVRLKPYIIIERIENMGLIEFLVRQSGKPSGIVGRIMQSIGFINILIENKDTVQCILAEK